jgi:hypothetical protein
MLESKFQCRNRNSTVMSESKFWHQNQNRNSDFKIETQLEIPIPTSKSKFRKIKTSTIKISMKFRRNFEFVESKRLNKKPKSKFRFRHRNLNQHFGKLIHQNFNEIRITFRRPFDVVECKNKRLSWQPLTHLDVAIHILLWAKKLTKIVVAGTKGPQGEKLVWTYSQYLEVYSTSTTAGQCSSHCCQPAENSAK